MILRFPWPSACLAVGLLTSDVLQAQVPSAGPGFPSPLGTPTPSVSATNNYRTTRKDGLKYLEEELTKSLQFLSGKGSLNGVLAPPPVQAPPIQGIVRTQRPRENSDASDSWSNLGRPDDDSNKGQDMLGLAGKNKNDRKQATFDDRYGILSRDRSAVTTTGPKRNDGLDSRYSRNRSDAAGSSEDDGVTGAVREKERALREKITGEKGPDRIFNPGGSSGVLSELFSPTDRELSRDQIQSHQDYLNRYRQVLAPSTADRGMLASPLPGATARTPSPVLGSGGLDSFSSPFRRDNSAAAPSGLTMALRPTALPDLNNSVLSQWNPLREPPRYDPPKPVAPQSPPFMEVPRRKF